MEVSYQVKGDQYEIDAPETELGEFGLLTGDDVTIKKNGEEITDFGEAWAGNIREARNVLFSVIGAYFNNNEEVTFDYIDPDIIAFKEEFNESSGVVVGNHEIPKYALHTQYMDILKLDLITESKTPDKNGIVAYSNNENDTYIITSSKDGRLITDYEVFWSSAVEEEIFSGDSKILYISPEMKKGLLENIELQINEILEGGTNDMTEEERNQKMVDDLIKVQEEVMGKQEDKEVGEVKEAVNDVKETVEGSEKEQDSMMNVGHDEQDKGEKKEYKEITLKFGKGYVGEEFEAKDGKKYRQVSIPNEDKNDKSSWRTFVVRANQVHDNKYGKGMFCKLPADGKTTVMKSVKTGIDENGKDIWENTKTKVPNKELKKMVESYKVKDKESSLQNKIAKKQTEVDKNKSAEKQTPNKAHDQSR